MKYRAEIDGLRTLAVFPVILFHLGYGFIIGGYYGVDVFFVISGFLITTILTKKIISGEFSMYDFWIRRVKRLLPPLLTVVIFTLIFARLFIFKPYIVDIAKDTAPAIFSYFNFHALYDFGDYWGSLAEKSFFTHTWSLSVEEQFYLIYPFFLFFVYKYFKTFLIPLLLLTGVSFLSFVYYLNIDRQLTFYMLPTRIWELSAGGIISTLPYKKIKSKLLRNLVPIIGVFLIGCSYLFASEKIDLTVVSAVTGTLLILMFCSKEDILGKILAAKPLVYLGKLSYSLYLWHWPIIVFFGCLQYQFQDYHRHLINLSILILTFVFSILSYHFIENKTRNYKQTPKIVLAAIVVVMGAVIYIKSDFFNIYYKSNFDKVIYYLNYYDISPTQPTRSKAITYKTYVPDRPKEYDQAYKYEGIVTKVKNKAPEIIVLGDSHGVMWSKTISNICDESEISRSFYTANASNPFFNIKDIEDQKANKYFTKTQRLEYARSLKNNIDQWNPKLFIIACRWENNIKDKGQFIDLLNYLNTKKIKVLVINQPPSYKFFNRANASQFLSYLNIKPNKKEVNYIWNNNFEAENKNKILEEVCQPFENVAIFNINKKMRKGNASSISYGDTIFYFDEHHLSLQGTEYFKDDLKKVIISQLK